MRLLSSLLFASLVLLGASEARANGRFPETNAVFFAPSDPDYVILRTTFGVMVTHDHGKTWSWVCDQSLGLAGVEDPMIAITPDKTLISTTFEGLSISHDSACNFGFVGGDLDLVFIDLTNRAATPGTVVTFASSYGGTDDAGATVYRSKLFETTDQGTSWSPLAFEFDSTTIGETVDVTESDPDRIYVSSIRNPGDSPSGFMLVSKDHGKTFAEHPIPFASTDRAAYIAGVDPTNADRVYLRTAGTTKVPTSRLLVSNDGGVTYTSPLTDANPLRGFALSSDGKRVYVGSTSGLWSASSTDLVFTKISDVEIGCLKFNAEGLWACSSEKSGFILGLSTDNGATFAPKLHFCDISGPLACAAGSTTNNSCAQGVGLTPPGPPWPLQRISLGCSDTPDAGDSDSGTDAGPASPPPLDSSGGCSLGAPGTRPVAAVVGAFVALAILRRRRRAPRR